MRRFSFLTVGTILDELAEEIEALKKDGVPVDRLTRSTFYRLQGRLKFPKEHKTVGGWRVYTREEADAIKNKILKNYRYL